MTTTNIRLRPLGVLLLALFGALLLSACSGSEDAGSGSNATLGFTYSTATSAAPAGTAGPLLDVSSDVTLDTFLVGLRKIELEADASVEEETEFGFEGPFVVDVLDPVGISVGGTSLPAGTYEELEMKLANLALGAPAPAEPLALYIAGSYNNATTPQPFQIIVRLAPSADANLEMESEGTNSIVIDGSSNPLLVNFPLDQLFDNTFLSGLPWDTSDPAVSVLDLTVPDDGAPGTPAAWSTLQSHFDSVLEVGEDRNGDDHLDDSEDIDDDSPSV